MSVWIANYEENEIRIETSYPGWNLFVNNFLQDVRVKHFPYSEAPGLTGHLISKNGEKIPIKVKVVDGVKKDCFLFIDDTLVKTVKVRKRN